VLASAGYLHLTAPDRAPREEGRVRLVLAVKSEPRARAVYEAAVEKFMDEHPEIEVELRVVTGGGSRYYQKLLVMIAGKRAPDLMWMGQQFAAFAERGAFLEITDRLAEANRRGEADTSNFFPQPLGWYRMNGRQYGVPFGIDMNFTIYNKKLFDEAGLAYPTADWDYEEFLAKAIKLTADWDGDGRTDRFGFSGTLGRASFGADFVSADGRQGLCETDEMLHFMKTNRDLILKHKVMPAPNDDTHSAAGLDNYALFRQKRTAMIEMYTWNLPYMAGKFADMEWDLVLSPKMARRAQWASSGAILISADTKHPDEAWELCQVFFSREFLKAMSFQHLPPDRTVAREVIEEHEGQPENLRALLTAAEEGLLFPTLRVPKLEEIRQAWLDGRDEAWDPNGDPDDEEASGAGMRRAQTEVEQIIRKARRERME